MDKLVVLNFGHGTLHSGFATVQIQLWEPDNLYPIKFTGQLPPAPHIAHLYQQWQVLYAALYQRLNASLRIEIESADVTHVSEVEFDELCQRLAVEINRWLACDGFRAVDQQLRTQLARTDTIRVILETDNRLLWKLPWHLWRFFDDYPTAEMALSPAGYQRRRTAPRQTFSNKVNILAVFGSSRGIDIQTDRTYLEQLSPQAHLTCLVEPTLHELNDHLWQRHDILFFAGHSVSQAIADVDQSNSPADISADGLPPDDGAPIGADLVGAERRLGRFYINDAESLTIDQLRYALGQAIANGLMLAIFNSCDGLGLAQALADLHIPQVVVMREQVPDAIAQQFLQWFLAAFSSGQPLYTAMRQARERLQGVERDYPCASWLPVICQNPAEPPMHWPIATLDADEPPDPPPIDSRRPRLAITLLIGAAVAALTMSARHLGWLQPWELVAYDQTMRSRPVEAPDDRVLLVTITEGDFQLPQQQQRIGSLADAALLDGLNALLPHQPAAIGLDLYRDFAVQLDNPVLAQHLQTDERLFVICKVSDRVTQQPGIAPPPEVPLDRQGFSDSVVDHDGSLRRHLIALNPSPTSPCQTPYGLAAQLAFYDLHQSGLEASFSPEGELRLGTVPVPQLHIHWGGYHTIEPWGYQTMLNYRSHRFLTDSFAMVTLTDLLNGAVAPDQIRDRIVLIGVVATSAGDQVTTPYSRRTAEYDEMPGVVAQAQMVSQLLNAVYEGRSLIRVWPIWRDGVWVWGWAALGGMLVLIGQKYTQRQVWLLIGVSGMVVLGSLVGLCVGLLVQGVWVPLVPAALASALTAGLTGLYLHEERQ